MMDEKKMKTGLIDVIVSSVSEASVPCDMPGCACDKGCGESASLADTEELDVLRAFDANESFGPCVGLSRLSRWARAAKFNLDPPARVKDILDSLEETDPAQQSSVTDCLS